MEKVLVLLATYNGEKYLREQLDSLFAQQGVEVSVWVRDDGSKDNTLEILKEYEAKSDLRWYQGPHLNVQKGFFELVQKAAETDYKYFAFCDQDDVWDQDKLSIAVSKMNENTDRIPKLYYCGQRLVDGDLNFIEEHRMNPIRTDCARFMLNDAAGCTQVFNRELIDAVVSYVPDYMLMHDVWILKICLALGGKIFVDNDCHMSYRQHGNNVMGLKRDFRSKFKQVKIYINEYKVEPQMAELKKGFDKQMTDEYRQIVDDVLAYKKSFSSRSRLTKKKKFNFGDRGLQLTYNLKIFLNKL